MKPIDKVAISSAIKLCHEGKGVAETLRTLQRIYKIQLSKESLHHKYVELRDAGKISSDALFEASYKKIPVRSWSGVLVITVVLRPDRFSCTFDCAYCPDETVKNGAKVDMPRSYLSSEPAVMRAMAVEFDIVDQFHSRLNTLRNNGHTIDKLEVIILGGTYSIYPRSYQIESMRDIFYAANVFSVPKSSRRGKLSLHDEQAINDKFSKMKVIGVSVETRPDMITNKELVRFRHLGITRVQIGVQHTDDDVLKLINRKHDSTASVKAIKLLKDHGFKVDIHIMPDLPGSNVELDRNMLEKVFLSREYQADYVKIYPCLDITHTKIRKWKAEGIWRSYAEEDMVKLIDLLIYTKQHLIPDHVRINRIQRDFPEESSSNDFLGFKSKSHKTNLRQLLDQKMLKMGIACKCIRCREIKNDNFSMDGLKMRVKLYTASEGLEYFICFEDRSNDKLLAFLRLRLPSSRELPSILLPRNTALIRELHVFGFINAVGQKSNSRQLVQHLGMGKMLIRKAEMISYASGFKKLSVISGVGVRSYYRKLGYGLSKTYMIKSLNVLVYVNAMIHMFLIWAKLRVSSLVQKII